MNEMTLIDQWNSKERQIAVYRLSNNELEARIQSQKEGQMILPSSQIKCGIKGMTSHSDFIKKIEMLAQKNIKDFVAVFAYPSEGKAEKIWIFEATRAAAPWIQKAKEFLEQMNSQPILFNFLFEEYFFRI